MIRNQKGITIVELLVGVGLMALVTGVIVATQVNVAKEQNAIVKKLDDSIDQNLAERIIFKDLNSVDLSYNNVTLPDDNGNVFFDFYPDIPESSITKEKERILTLSLKGKKEFYILSQNVNAGALLVYDPVWAYDLGAENGDANVPVPLTFNPGKNQMHLSNEKHGRPGFWEDGIVLMYDTPARIRPITGNTVDMETPPRSPIFLGGVNPSSGAGLQSLNSSVAAFIDTTQPKDGKTAITSLDNFLRTVPPIGGGQSVVRVRAVHIFKYYLEVDTKKVASEYKTAPALLYKSTYRNGKFENPMLLADGVGSFTLRRDSVLKRMIYFKVEKAKKNNEL
jgi:hypothetical protein